MEKDWVVIYNTNKLYQAEMLKEILFDNGIEAVILNKKDSAYLIGDAEVYVHQSNEIQSREFVKTFED